MILDLDYLIISSDLKYFFIYALRILLACLSGLVIGVERKKKNREAGIRTHMIVILGSCLAMIVSKYGFSDSTRFDAARVSAQVISGIGFLGVGIIFVKNYNIKGLTTAAGIWTSSIIGLCYGAGLILTGAFATLIMLVIQIFIFEWLDADQGELVRIVIISSKYQTLKDVEKFLDDSNIKFRAKFIYYEEDDIKYSIKCRISDKKNKDLVIQYLINNDEVNKFYFI